MTDLHELFETAKGDLPPARYTLDEITESGRRRAKRRTVTRGLAMTGSAAAVAAVVAAGAAGALPIGHSSAPATGTDGAAAAKAPAGLVGFSFAGFSAGDYEVAAPAVSTPGYQVASVFHTTSALGGGPATINAGTLTVYAPGVFNAAGVKATGTATVNGKPAQVALFPQAKQVAVGGDAKTKGKLVPKTENTAGLYWQYAKGAYAVFQSTTGVKERGVPLDAMKQLAAKFTVTAATPVRVPWTASVPKSWTLVQAGAHNLVTDKGDTSTISEAIYSSAPVSFGSLTQPHNFATEGSPVIVISVVDSRAGRKAGGCDLAQLWCDQPIAGTTFYTEVNATQGKITAAELGTITKSLKVDKKVDAPASWNPIR